MFNREAGCLRPVMWIHITGFFYAFKPISTHYYIYSQPHYIMASARITLCPSPSHIMAPAQVETQDFASHEKVCAIRQCYGMRN